VLYLNNFEHFEVYKIKDEIQIHYVVFNFIGGLSIRCESPDFYQPAILAICSHGDAG
jgi:hypothetical protein